MLSFLIPQKWTTKQVSAAAAKRAEFRRNRYTTGSAHLDDLVTLGKAVMLCDSHTRPFSLRATRYERHPDPMMRHVRGNCDVCNTFGLLSLFICPKDAAEYRRTFERQKRDLEYARIVTT